ncbi:substrate-binding periplasmic protein [Flocculibacter collagenilyticus]|uniref:substrate-binding periplasmic protein n=1 Tax=Flocculibacter collagenilyticus TaxID=2744479 RepID=UPI0018F57706|nr:transporter substrate-binding domain-containing protein [Flocculibacter collagenilyticus]
MLFAKYFNILILLFLSIFCCVQATTAQELEELVWLTEDYPPFAYVNEQGEPDGLYVNIVKALWKKAGIDANTKISVLPWARAYKLAQTDKKYVLFPMKMSDPRKKLFRFLGPINGLSDNGIIVKSDALKSYKQNVSLINHINLKKNCGIGVLLHSSDINELLWRGVKEDCLVKVSTVDQLARMLIKDRLQFVTSDKATIMWELEKLGEKLPDYKMIYVFEPSDGGIALHKKVGNETYDVLNQAFNELATESFFEKIMSDYLNNRSQP